MAADQREARYAAEEAIMKEYGVKNIVFSSSATVYGDPEQLPLTEDCALRTTNPYGATKLMIENILRDVCHADQRYYQGTRSADVLKEKLDEILSAKQTSQSVIPKSSRAITSDIL